MNFNFDFGKYFQKQITASIDAMNLRLEAQANSILASADAPRLAVQAQLNRITESQIAIQKHFEELTRLPDLPNISSILINNSILKNISDRLSNMRVIMQGVSPEYIESEVEQFIDNDVDFIEEFTEFNELYQSQILDGATLHTLEKVQDVLSSASSAILRISINMTGVYVPESYRIILNKHFERSNHYLTQTMNSTFTSLMTTVFNELFSCTLPENIFLYIYLVLFVITFGLDLYKYKIYLR